MMKHTRLKQIQQANIWKMKLQIYTQLINYLLYHTYRTYFTKFFTTFFLSCYTNSFFSFLTFLLHIKRCFQSRFSPIFLNLLIILDTLVHSNRQQSEINFFVFSSQSTAVYFKKIVHWMVSNNLIVIRLNHWF